MISSIPMEWVDKIFNCLEVFYGERWKRLFKDEHHLNLYKTIWKNGLFGLDYDQIKHALIVCKRDAPQPRAMAPTVMEFFRYAKRQEMPYRFE